MCVGRRPSPPPLPPKQVADSRIEPTTQRIAISDSRTFGQKKKKSGNKVSGGKAARAVAPKRLGTRSLQIPLLSNTSSTENLNYT
tara:strand:- start:229 stop:483 length:255 start_codon:yes stop_codon:yes gene_type:complete